MRDYFDWRNESACDETNWEKFFPTEIAKSSTEARAICKTCPVKDECLMHAIIYGEGGIWGGETEEFRERMAKSAKATLTQLAISQGVFHIEFIRRHGQ